MESNNETDTQTVNNMVKRFFEEALEQPYQPNTQDNPLHEKNIEKLLKKYELSYIYQPNGTNRSPDFKVEYLPGKTIDIECKSCKYTSCL